MDCVSPTIKLARNCHKEVNKHLSDDKKLSLSLSNGWRGRFKNRYGLAFWHFHDELMGAHDSAIGKSMPRIVKIFGSFVPKDVWNADAFWIF